MRMISGQNEKKDRIILSFLVCEGSGNRTHDQRLKRPLLYLTELYPLFENDNAANINK